MKEKTPTEPAPEKDPYELFKQCKKEAQDVELTFDSEGNLLAPNGKISEYNKLRKSKEQKSLDEPALLLAAIMRTPSFLKKMGNWMRQERRATKLVHSSTGEPMVAFHGTNYDFFQNSRGPDIQPKIQTDAGGHGQIMSIAWFTTDPDAAHHFSRKSRIIRAGSGRSGLQCWEEPGFIFPAFLHISNPQYFKSNRKMKDRIYQSPIALFFPGIRKWLLYPRVYDGIIQTKGDVDIEDFDKEADQCGVFDTSQIMQLPFNVSEFRPQSGYEKKLIWGGK